MRKLMPLPPKYLIDQVTLWVGHAKKLWIRGFFFKISETKISQVEYSAESFGRT